MSERLAETVAEVARRLGGEWETDGPADAGRFGLGGGENFAFGELVVSGKLGERPVLVDFPANGELKVRIQCSGSRTFRIRPRTLLGTVLSFSRRVLSGDEVFDDRFRVDHQSGPPPGDLLEGGDFREAVLALAPFEQILFGNGVARCVALYDSESVSPEDVVARVASLAALAAAAEESRE